MPSGHTGVTFQNLAEESPDRNISDYDYFYNGGGVAIGDLDGDDLPEIFFTGNDVNNRLYRNLGNFEFEDVSESAGIAGPGWATGVCFVDVNRDNLADIYVCYAGPDDGRGMPVNKLFINLGNLEFEENASEFGLDIRGLSIHSVFFDADGDGDQDCLVLKHAPRNLGNLSHEWVQRYSGLKPGVSSNFETVLLNNDKGHFSPDPQSLKPSWGFGLGAAVSDFNDDNQPDIYVANDYFIEDKYYFNNRGSFQPQAWGPVAHSSYYSMGCAAGDINNDGLSDLVVLDMTPADHYRSKMMMSSMNPEEFSWLVGALRQTPQYMINTLQLNAGNGQMSEIAQIAGVDKTDWSWAPLLADFDNDCRPDLYVTNGVKRDVENNDWRLVLMSLRESPGFDEEAYFQHLLSAPSSPITNPFYFNLDGLRFEERSVQLGLVDSTFSNGAAYGDLDQDGDLDIVVNNLEHPATLIRNNSSQLTDNHFLRIKLLDGKGDYYRGYAKIRVYSGGRTLLQENQFSRGYQSYCEPVIHFGLGKTAQVDSVIIHWGPDEYSAYSDLEVDQTHELSVNKVKRVETAIASTGEMTQEIIKSRLVHKSAAFPDFDTEVLLPHRMSQLGPGAGEIDFNSDGLVDAFIGGGSGQKSRLIRQNADGTFSLHRSTAFDLTKQHDVLGAASFDANGDGWQDLYVAYGGPLGAESELQQDILFLNDGHGELQRSDWLPDMHSSTRAIAPMDYDGDGDLDLFVGGRNTPGSYPVASRSFLLENTGNAYIDITPEDLLYPGMVTDAAWGDLNNDEIPDLLLCGEWMEPTWFVRANETFEKHPVHGLNGMSGWWNCVKIEDLNGDGVHEIIAGNLGLNNKFQPSLESPLYCYYGDVDDNGQSDILLAKSGAKGLLPVRGLECSSEQVPGLVNSIESYDQFASGTILDIYGEDAINASNYLEATGFESGVFWYENGEYRFEPFPIVAQFAPINDMVIDDFDEDGIKDILFAGNNSLTEVETVAYDAGKGGIMFGSPEGEFETSHRIDRTGLFLPGNVRKLLWLEREDHDPVLLIINNNAPVQVWAPN